MRRGGCTWLTTAGLGFAKALAGLLAGGATMTFFFFDLLLLLTPAPYNLSPALLCPVFLFGIITALVSFQGLVLGGICCRGGSVWSTESLARAVSRSASRWMIAPSGIGLLEKHSQTARTSSFSAIRVETVRWRGGGGGSGLIGEGKTNPAVLRSGV